MFAGIIVGLGIAGLIYYVHRVGLPAVLQELKQARIEVVAAINRHATPQAKPNPIPLTAAEMVQARQRSASAGPDLTQE